MNWLIPFIHWFEVILHSYGVGAATLLIFLEEASFPIPIPGDALLAYTGYEVTKGSISYGAAYFLMLIAVLAGSSFLYYVARRWGNTLITRYGKYIHLDIHRLKTVEGWFARYGWLAVVIGRHIPGFRLPILLFAGISKMPYPRYLLSTIVSIALWIPLYMNLGKAYGPHLARIIRERYHTWELISLPLVIAIVSALFLYARVQKKRR